MYTCNTLSVMKIAAAGDNGPKMAVGDENTSSNAGRTKESSRGKSSKSIPQLKLPKGFAAVPVSLDPPALRLNKMDEAELPKLQSRVDNLRYRGRLHQDSPALVDLAHVHVRRIALCRLAYGGQGFPGADAHFDCGSSYARMGLWSQALSHAKKSLHVHDRVAPGGAAQVDEEVLSSIFEGIDPSLGPIDCDRIRHAIMTSEYARDFAPVLDGLTEKVNGDKNTSTTTRLDFKGLVELSKKAQAHTNQRSGRMQVAKGRTLALLGRCYVHSPLKTGKKNRVVEAQRILTAAMDMLGVPPLGCDQEEEDGLSESRVHGVEQRDLCLARAEVCCAMAELRMQHASAAEKLLRKRSNEAADEWLLGEEGQAALQEMTRELTEKALRSGKSSKDIVTMRQNAESRATSKLLKETSDAIRQQLLNSPDAAAGGRVHSEAVVEWFVRAWVLRETSYDRDHPEMGLIYERLGEAHLQCETREGNDEAASMFRTALNIFKQNASSQKAGDGNREPIVARVATRLGRAESLCEAWSEAAAAYTIAAEFFEKEAERGVRLEESIGNNGDRNIDIDDVLCINHKSGMPLVVPVILGVIPTADKARELYHVASSAFGKYGAWLESRTSLSRAVQISTKHYGAGSVEVADDLTAIGRLCLKEDVCDYRYAERAITPALRIYKLHLGGSGSNKIRTVENLVKKMKAMKSGARMGAQR